jgi:16S rRNA (adenine1518-N6/adenine1519-N6)-dimethyltransferase
VREDDARAPRPPKPGRLPPVRKSLGQHFLSDPRILSRIADALQLTGTETVVEVGPGRGALTEELARRAGTLVAVELDRALAALLRERWATSPHVRVVEADVLAAPLHEVAGTEEYYLIGNVPYYITTPILFHALERPRARRSVFLVQREVAERIVAPPGADDYGALSVNVQAVARPELLFRVAPGSFHPPPKVESAVIRVEPRADPVVAPEEEARFRTFVQEAFGLRRKQMRRVLRTVLSVGADRADEILAAAGVDPAARPEVLSPEDFARLLRASPGGRGAG